MKIVKCLFVFSFLLVAVFVSAQQTETRKVSSFNRVDVGTPFDVFVEEGGEESVKLALENISLNEVITEVKDNTLKVYLKKGNYKNIKGKVYISYKKLDAINNSGSGNLNCNSDIAADNFTIGLSGSGNANTKRIKAQLIKIRKSGSGNTHIGGIEADNSEISISGSGELVIKDGNVKKESVSISGSGNVKTFGVKSDECSVSISGSGNVEVNAAKALEGRISGSGNITYEGAAQITKSSIGGSGRIHKR